MKSLLCLLLLAEAIYVAGEYQSAGCSDEGCGIPCYLRPAEDECHYTEHNPCDGGETELDQELWLLNNSLVRLQEKLIQKGIIPAGNSCPPLPIIASGGVIYSDLLLSIGVVAHFVCEDGFSLHGHGQYECSVDGVWIGSDSQEIRKEPICLGSVIICEPLVPIPYGHISYHIVDTTRVQPGDVAYHSCDDLYTLHGTEERICMRNGKWSGMEPECVAPTTMASNSSEAAKEKDGSLFKITIPAAAGSAVVAVLIIIIIIIVIVKCAKKKKAKTSYQELRVIQNPEYTEYTEAPTDKKSKKLLLEEDQESLLQPGVATLQAEQK